MIVIGSYLAKYSKSAFAAITSISNLDEWNLQDPLCVCPLALVPPKLLSPEYKNVRFVALTLGSRHSIFASLLCIAKFFLDVTSRWYISQVN